MVYTISRRSKMFEMLLRYKLGLAQHGQLGKLVCHSRLPPREWHLVPQQLERTCIAHLIKFSY